MGALHEYDYLLEEVAINGATTQHGPVTAATPDPAVTTVTSLSTQGHIVSNLLLMLIVVIVVALGVRKERNFLK